MKAMVVMVMMIAMVIGGSSNWNWLCDYEITVAEERAVRLFAASLLLLCCVFVAVHYDADFFISSSSSSSFSFGASFPSFLNFSIRLWCQFFLTAVDDGGWWLWCRHPPTLFPLLTRPPCTAAAAATSLPWLYISCSCSSFSTVVLSAVASAAAASKDVEEEGEDEGDVRRYRRWLFFPSFSSPPPCTSFSHSFTVSVEVLQFGCFSLSLSLFPFSFHSVRLRSVCLSLSLSVAFFSVPWTGRRRDLLLLQHVNLRTSTPLLLTHYTACRLCLAVLCVCFVFISLSLLVRVRRRRLQQLLFFRLHKISVHNSSSLVIKCTWTHTHTVRVEKIQFFCTSIWSDLTIKCACACWAPSPSPERTWSEVKHAQIKEQFSPPVVCVCVLWYCVKSACACLLLLEVVINQWPNQCFKGGEEVYWSSISECISLSSSSSSRCN